MKLYNIWCSGFHSASYGPKDTTNLFR